MNRDQINRAIRAGMRKARAEGGHVGRPRVSAAVERRIRKLLGAGVGILTTARKVGVGTAVVQRVKAASHAT